MLSRFLKANSVLPTIIVGFSLIVILSSRAMAQSPPSGTESQIWPEVDAHLEFRDQLRVLAFSGVQQGVGFPYQQWFAAAGLGYQFKRIPRIEKIDPDKEHYLVLGGGYEFLRTIQSGKVTEEDRVIIDLTFSYHLPADLLVRDRNWIELRWVNGTYSTTYRNMVFVEHGFLVHGIHFTPYGSAEIFYNGDKHSWNQEWYTAGIQWPYKHSFMLDMYYRRENCPSCVPANWNVAGLTLNFYSGNKK
ncbi:MAG: DUF2490 domain-containing protein [Acidobacteriaceae bacterium]|nr:DUF2490 domain-containing protein [Acidobacteriaceae bacterium]